MKCITTFIAVSVFASGLARGDEPTPVEMRVSETLNVCKAGLVRCPVSSFLCDDPKVAIIEGGADGAVLKGLSAGTTLCSVLGPGTAFRRVLRVTVEATSSQKPQ